MLILGNKETMEKIITFYIDKEDGVVSLHKHDRTCANQLAEGFGETIGMFVTMLANEVDRMPKSSSISIIVKKEL